MKKIKKLTLNKEVVSILGGNEMNLVKGGVYTDNANASCLGFISCGCPIGGGVGGGAFDTVTDCTAAVSGTCGPAPYTQALTCAVTCKNTCAVTCGTCANTCPATCGGPYHSIIAGGC